MRIRIADRTGRDVLVIDINSNEYSVIVEESAPVAGITIKKSEETPPAEPVSELKVMESRERILETIRDREALRQEIQDELETLMGESESVVSEERVEEKEETKPPEQVSEAVESEREGGAEEPLSDEEFLEEDFEKAKEMAEKLKEGTVPEYKPQAVPKKSSKEDRTRELLRSILDYTP